MFRRRLLVAAVVAAVAAAPADAATAHDRAHIELLEGGVSAAFDGAGEADGGRRLSTFAFRSGGTTGAAILVGHSPLVAYVKGPKTGAPDARPWAKFVGKSAAPFFDPRSRCACASAARSPRTCGSRSRVTKSRACFR